MEGCGSDGPEENEMKKSQTDNFRIGKFRCSAQARQASRSGEAQPDRAEIGGRSHWLPGSIKLLF
jgi:hypothetical protein